MRASPVNSESLAATPANAGFRQGTVQTADLIRKIQEKFRGYPQPLCPLDARLQAFLDAFFDEIGSAPDTEALLVGLYEHAVPALHAALGRHMADTNCLFDQPSRRICRFALLEVADMQAYGAQAVSALVESERSFPWERSLRARCRASALSRELGDGKPRQLAVAHAEGVPLAGAVRFASAAGAVCCQTFGAQPALLVDLLARHAPSDYRGSRRRSARAARSAPASHRSGRCGAR